LAHIKRRRRTRCKLACKIVISAKESVKGRVVTLSEGGLAVLTAQSFEQGDALRLIIDPNGAKPIRVSAIIWNDTAPRTTNGESRLRRLGCIVSQPSESFSALLDRLLPVEESVQIRAPEPSHPAPVPITVPKQPILDDSSAEHDLPRSRELQPPTKLEPEESLPYFRIRLKQIGGPRTRIMTIQARSATQAESRALEELRDVCQDADGWGVLHVAKVSSGAR
jgi:hypothetical protein